MGIEKINYYSKSNVFNPENLTKDFSLTSASMDKYGDLTLVSNIKEKLNDEFEENIDSQESSFPQKQGMGKRYKPNKYGNLSKYEAIEWNQAYINMKKKTRDQPYKKGKDTDEYIQRKEIKQAFERKVA